MEPLSEGNAVIEYDVLNRELGDFAMANLRPVGTSKSNMAENKVSITFRICGMHLITARTPCYVCVEVIVIPTRGSEVPLDHIGREWVHC